MTEVVIQPGESHRIVVKRPAVYEIKIERIGIPGPGNSLSIGTVVEGGTADASITGKSPDQKLNLVLPQAEDGKAATIDVGSVTTLAPGEPVTVTNTGTEFEAILDFGIPEGPPGNDGIMASVVAGTGISVDNTDPANPVVSATGGGSGDMQAATYDPQGIADDAFDRANHTGLMPISALEDGTSAGLVGRTSGALPFGVIALSSSATASSVVYRRSGGRAAVGAPTANDDATTKLYVDTGLAGKADTSSLGSAAAANVGDFATAGQGAKADSAVQPAAIADMLETSDIGSSVQAYDAATAKLNAESQTLTGGATVTSKDLGTITTGTVTANAGHRPQQHYANNGPHTLAAGVANGSYLLDITNGASAGVITAAGWTKVAGDSFTTASGDKFRCHCSIGPAGSLLIVQALQ